MELIVKAGQYRLQWYDVLKDHSLSASCDGMVNIEGQLTYQTLLTNARTNFKIPNNAVGILIIERMNN